MKYRLIIFLIFITSFCYSQKYNFDIYSCYFNDNVKWKQVILTSSNNDKIKVILNQKNDFYIGAIREFTKDSLIFHFVEARIDSSKSPFIEFKYTSSIKGKLKNERKCFDQDNFYEISEKQLTEDRNEITIFRYKNEKKNKLISKVILQTKDISFNFINHFTNGYFHVFIDCQSLEIGKNKLVEKASFFGEDNYHLNLIDYKNIPIEINIQNQNYKK